MFANHLVIRHKVRRNEPMTLSWSQYLFVLSTLCLLGGSLAIVLAPYDVSEALHRQVVRQYERDFGFEVGRVHGPHTPPEGMWAIARVTSGGRMDRAGVRSGDAVFTQHGGGFGELHWAIKEATAGRTACFDLVNVEDMRVGRFESREVCLNGNVRP